MVSGSERSSRDGSRPRRLRTLSVPLPPTSQAIPPPPTSQGLPPAPTSQQLPLPLTLQQIAPSSSPQDSSAASTSSVADDAIASVPAGVHPSDWQTMCEMWTTGDERSNMHGRTPHRLEVFKMGRCKDLPDGTESWVDEESRRRYEAMNEMITPSNVDAESHTTVTPEDAFISVMGKDRPGHVRCAGSGETLSTWYGSTGLSAYSERERKLQEQLKVQEEKLKAQAEKMNQMEEKISQLESVSSKVDEMSLLLSQI
ncbi:hypothetical protein Taro_008463 [Colocasia esculenta]|uniref:Uncharacterized protein n=1 Tax=Colocasia esculenta TaxID=4460 RepID=A0A843U1X0_COLES|nr:hypothetical protein [Colocasia esculenta]